ncbi:hypothetical protein MMC11_008558 [Xylographa trunciseda]|nr:hypothetical protein [Xylographa trunciseda]
MDVCTAAALPTVYATTGLALFHSLGLQAILQNPAARPFPVLVYGGSTATVSGLDPLMTCSPRKFDLAKSYGAAEEFDYRTPACAGDIRSFSKGWLRYGLDCITDQQSIKVCHAAIGRAGGKYTALDQYPEAVAKSRKGIVADRVLGPTMLGKEYRLAGPARHQGERRATEVWSRLVQSVAGALGRGKASDPSAQGHGWRFRRHPARDGDD